ncbi:MAG: Crp/Fnr family transcriptional regulator [Deferrisomatales bacterium]|nr:Crp/Fnr family transcriptional regulator [Deferrisomatales bacterium]
MSETTPSCLCRQTFGDEVAGHAGCIGQLWLFEGLSDADRAALGPRLHRRRHDAGTILFREGDPGDHMYLLKAGAVKLSKITEDGRALTLDVRRPGDLLGESCFLEESEFPVTGTCLEPTITCGFTRGVLESVVLEHPTVGLALIRNLSRRIQWLTGRVGALTEPHLEDRMYQALVNVARQVGQPGPKGWVIEFPLSHEEIGFLVGAHRVSVTRALGRLRDAGKIQVEGKAILVREQATV